MLINWKKKSNGSEKCTNFITFAASVNEEPLLKEALSKLSDFNEDDMSFNIAYETLYKECLSLKQEQVTWKAFKKMLDKWDWCFKMKKTKVFLDKIAFLESEHEVKRKCVLKSKNQIFKDELSLRKEDSHPNSKRLNDFINSGRKSSNKMGLWFVDKNTTPSSVKTIFFKAYKEEHPKKTHSQIKFHFSHSGKMWQTFHRCYAKCSIIFKESWPT